MQIVASRGSRASSARAWVCGRHASQNSRTPEVRFASSSSTCASALVPRVGRSSLDRQETMTTKPATVVAKLRARALRMPGAEEGVACEGTALERRTIKASKKAFVFLGTTDVMLKLGPSLQAAARLQAEGSRVNAGKGGWVKIDLTGSAPPVATLEAWVDESYATLVAAAPPRKKVAARKPPAKKVPAKKVPAKKAAAKRR